MTYEYIKTSVDDGVGIITLSDPERLNAVNVVMLQEFGEVLDGFAKRGSGVRCVVITGEGRGFCAGFNMQVMNKRGSSDASGIAAESGAVLRNLPKFPLPIITAVNGPAAGVGSSIALLGDLVVGAESAYLLLAFRHRGFAPDGGGTYLISRLAGKARAMELALLGEKLPMRTALEWGLINRCVPVEEVMPTALALAKNLASGATLALGRARQLFWEGFDSTWFEAYDAEIEAQGMLGKTNDCKEGVLSFLEKRKPVFTGT
ncbi:MAG: enoyl-CoA hydratase-related protein [Hyphomonadaceae bacterium]